MVKHLPEMRISDSIYTKNKLFKRIGPVILGFWFDTRRCDPEVYETVMFIDHLFHQEQNHFWSGGINTISGHATLCIPLSLHNQGFYVDLIEIFREKSWLPLEGEVTLDEICKVPDCIHHSYASISDGIYTQPDLFFPVTYAKICAWAGETEAAQQYYEKVLDIFKSRPKEKQEYIASYDLHCGKILNIDETGVALWEKMFTEQVQDYIKHPEKLRAIVKTNVENFGLGSI